MKITATSRNGHRPRVCPCRECDSAGGGGDEHENAGCVSAALRVNVGVKSDGDEEGYGHEDEDQRTRGARPLGRHAEARQVAGNQIEEPRHGRCSGKGENQDGADVVDGSECVAEVLVRQVGHGAAVGFATFCECVGRNENSGDEAGGDEEDAHDAGCGDEQLRVLRMRASRSSPRDQRHHGDAGFKSGEAQGEAREEKQADGDDAQPVRMLREERRFSRCRRRQG